MKVCGHTGYRTQVTVLNGIHNIASYSKLGPLQTWPITKSAHFVVPRQPTLLYHLGYNLELLERTELPHILLYHTLDTLWGSEKGRDLSL